MALIILVLWVLGVLYVINPIYGYCRGTEPVLYVKQIMIYYDILKRQGIEYGEAQAKLQLSARADSINQFSRMVLNTQL